MYHHKSFEKFTESWRNRSKSVTGGVKDNHNWRFDLLVFVEITLVKQFNLFRYKTVVLCSLDYLQVKEIQICACKNIIIKLYVNLRNI